MKPGTHVAMWAPASSCRRFTDTNVYGTGPIVNETSPKNTRRYTDIFTVYGNHWPRMMVMTIGEC